MAKRNQKPDFAQVALNIVERATGAALTEKPMIALASAPKPKRTSARRKK